MGLDAAGILAAYPAIDAALKQRPGHRLLITVPGAELPALRRRLSHEMVAAQPGRGAVWRLWLKPRLVMQVGNVERAGALDLRFADGQAVSAAAILAVLPPLPSPQAATGRGLREWLVGFAAGPPFGGLDSLRDRLGRPDRILCLGNGPSSEDPALAGIEFDRLFRVNWTWRERGHLTAPDVVFTADSELPERRHCPVICFPRLSAGMPVLLRHLLALRRPPGYLYLDRLPEFAGDLASEPIPSNGALMLAVAAALRPRDLVIAGIDLYAHAAGRYPGDPEALQGYSRLHDRDRDLELIRRALDRFDGRVTIFGEALRAALGGEE